MIYKCFMQCDRVCLNNLNHAFQSYLHAIINDIVTSDMVCQSDNNLNHAFQSYLHAIINDIVTSDMLCQSDNTFVLVKYTHGH